MDTKQKLQLRKFVNELKGIRGRHTELVSVYVPAGYDIIKIIQHLSQEQGTAQNIKDKGTRKNVIDSLERMVRHLRLFKKTPDNGLAIFSGNISDNPSKTDIQVFSLEPPEALNLRIYRCDHTFKLDVLEEMLDVFDTFGLIVMDNRDGAVGLLKGTKIEILREMHSSVPGKMKAGGQCLSKDTIISMSDGQFINIEEVEEGDEVISYDFTKKEFIPSKVKKKWSTKKTEVYTIDFNKDKLVCSGDHLIFTKDGSTKPAKELTMRDLLIDEKSNPIKIERLSNISSEQELIDLEIENKNFIANGIIVHNSQARFARLREMAAHDFYNRIGDCANKEFLSVKNLKGILLGGPGITKEKFENGSYLTTELKKKLITTQDLSYTGEFGLKELVEKSQDALAEEEIIKEKKLVQEFLLLVKITPKKAVYGEEKTKKALELGAVAKLLISETIEETDELELLANQMGTEVFVISRESEEGQQLKNLGGVAGILRYEVEIE